MHQVRQEHVRNAILSGLAREEFERLAPFLSRVQLVDEQILTEPGDRPEHAYFVESGIISIRDKPASGQPIQVAIVGQEGVVGCETLLSWNEPAFASTVTHRGGGASRILLSDLAAVLDHCPELRESCMKAVIALIKQVMQTAASFARDSLAQRCIRLLLMMHDRIEGEEVQVTHEVLSAMLGVRRSGVTQVTIELQKEGLVRVNRGRITILNRPRLQRQLSSLGAPRQSRTSATPTATPVASVSK